MARSKGNDPFNKKGFRQRVRVRGRNLINKQRDLKLQKRRQQLRTPGQKTKRG